VAGLAALPGCERAPAQTQQAPPKFPGVTVSQPLAAEVTDYEEFTGRVEAANKVGVQAMVTGYLVEKNFIDGENVEVGDILFKIDPRVFQAKANLAKAALDQATAHCERVCSDFERGRILVQNGSLSREDFEKLGGDRLEAKAAVEMAQAQFHEADVNLKYTDVKSPIKGRSSRRLIDVGNMVKANETMLTWIYQIDPMYGYFDVDERTVIKLRKLINEGKLKSYRNGKIFVDVGLADEEGFSIHAAYIDWVDNVLDAGTGTLKMRCVISQPRDPSTDEPMVLVSPGMFVRVKLASSTPHKALLISEKAVGTDQGEKYVFVVRKQNAKDTTGTIERINVTLGQMHDGRRVVESNGGAKAKNLQATDWVVISGLQRVRPGATVEATAVPMPRADSVPAADPALVSGPNKGPNGNGKAH
jgi:RND family efflux transporter MFP subunit